MEIVYLHDNVPGAVEVAALYDDAGLRRPTADLDRIGRMLSNANLIVTAWLNNKLVGIARSVTDFSYCCYLSDLAVASSVQNKGIGRHLIEETRKAAGPEAMLLLLSAPGAMHYYPKNGFSKAENAFFIPRTF